MGGFRVVTDSTSDLPPAWRERFGIEVVPLTVNFGNYSLKDRVDRTDDEFFARLAEAKSLPTTAAPAPGDFLKVYEKLALDGAEGIVSVHLGSGISGTVDSARVAAQQLEGCRVEVVDSTSVTMPIAFLARVAAEAPSFEDAVSRAKERVPKTRVLALLDTLRYVEMGGRVSRAQAMIGGLLDLKPILTMQENAIKSLDRVRTRSKAIQRMAEILLADQPVEYLAVMHAQAPDEAGRLREQLLEAMPGQEIEIGQIGCVLGTHTGPKALGLVYLKK